MMRFLFLCLCLVLCGCGDKSVRTGGTSPEADSRHVVKDKEGIATAVPFDQVPKEWLAVAQQKLPDVKFDTARKRKNGNLEVRGKDKNGKVREVEFDSKGEVVEIE